MYNEYTHYSEVTAGELLDRPRAFGMRTAHVDGQDFVAVRAAAAELIEAARNGEGPSFLQCDTYRYHGHHVGDIDRAYYRSKDEEATWKNERDPLVIFGRWLMEERDVSQEELDAIETEVKAEAEKAVAFGLDAPYPDESEVDQHVYA
jgi:pyruvate dehydrogenase E1 component alpha subunit